MTFAAASLQALRRTGTDNTVWFYVSADDLGTQIGSGYFNAAVASMRVDDPIMSIGAHVGTLFVVTANDGATVTIAQLATSEGAEPSDGDKGDVVVSGSGLTWTLDTVAIAKGGTGQITSSAAFDALTVPSGNIASAATTNLAAATGYYVVVTGTVTITSLGTVAAGVLRIVEFSGVLTLTHNATSLILHGSANITTAAGDVLMIISEGSGNWREVGYLKRGGLASQDKNNVNITGGAIAGIADLAVADGGTGSSTASGARTNLGVPYATAAEVQTGTEAAKVVTPATLTPKECICISVSDETSNLSTGVGKVVWRMPYAFKVSAVRASCTTAPTGATLIFDINEAGATILSTKLSIDASEKTSTTAASAAVISDVDLADDAEMSIDIDQVGSTITGAGGKIYLIGNRV